MDAIKKYFVSRKAILVLTFIFFAIRLPFLDSNYLLWDERDTALTQYSLAKTGKDLYGNRFPLVFDHISPHAPVLAMYYGVPFYFLGMPMTVSLTRLIYLIPFTVAPLLAYEILLVILKNRRLSLLTSLVFAFSPWIHHISRLALEVNIAFPLFLAAILSQLKRKHILAILFYGLAFFTYQGIRPLIFISMLYMELFPQLHRIRFDRIWRNSLIYICAFAVLFAGSALIETNTKSRGSSEIVFLNSEKLSAEVDYKRFISRSPTLLKPFFDNKITLMLNYSYNNLLHGLDPSYLFGTGDYVPIYSNGITGQFYPIGLLFLFAGIISIGIKRNREVYFISGFAVIGLISSLINTYSLTFSIRSLFSAIGFSFIISLGIIELYSLRYKLPKSIAVALITVLGIMVIFQTCSFYYGYMFHRPTLQAELFNENERSLSSYMLKNNDPYTVKTPNAFSNFLSFLFLENGSKNDFVTVQKILTSSKSDFPYKDIKFSQCQAKEIDFATKPNNLIIEETCISPEAKDFISEAGIPFDRIDYADYNFLDTQKRMKYYVLR